MIVFIVTLLACFHLSIQSSYSNTFRKQGDDGSYSFGYEIKNPDGSSNFRKEESRGPGHQWGSYGLFDKDGRKRVVDYLADEKGFRAHVRTNEPGTSSLDTGSASYSGPRKHETVIHSGKPKHHHVEKHPKGDSLTDFFEGLNRF